RPEERELPTEEQVASRRDGERLERLQRLLGEATRPPAEEWLALARRLWASSDGEVLVARLVERALSQAGQPASRAAAPAPAPAPAAATESAAPAAASEGAPAAEPSAPRGEER